MTVCVRIVALFVLAVSGLLATQAAENRFSQGSHDESRHHGRRFPLVERFESADRLEELRAAQDDDLRGASGIDGGAHCGVEFVRLGPVVRRRTERVVELSDARRRDAGRECDGCDDQYVFHAYQSAATHERRHCRFVTPWPYRTDRPGR